MKVAVWDTYVKKTDGTVMNFDILVPEDQTNTEIIYGYGKKYLESKSMSESQLTSNHCNLCHFETATDVMKEAIKEKGYHIVEIKNCQ